MIYFLSIFLIWLKCWLKDQKWSKLIEKVKMNWLFWLILNFLIILDWIQTIFNPYQTFRSNPAPNWLIFLDDEFRSKKSIEWWFDHNFNQNLGPSRFNRLSLLFTFISLSFSFFFLRCISFFRHPAFGFPTTNSIAGSFYTHLHLITNLKVFHLRGVAWSIGLHHCLPLQGSVVQISLRVFLWVLFVVFKK